MSIDPQPPDMVQLSAADIDRAVAEGVLAQSDADRLIHWASEQRFRRADGHVDQKRGFNFVTVGCYFGTLLVIFAGFWFLSDQWDRLAPRGISITVGTYILFTTGAGSWLRRKGQVVGGGLLITLAVCLVPILVYSIEKMIGFWPAQDASSYRAFYPLIHTSALVVEVVTLAVTAVSLRFVRFGVLAAPAVSAFWLLSLTVIGLIYRENTISDDQVKWASVIVGLATILFGFAIERILPKVKRAKAEDFPFWCYLFGLVLFWGALTLTQSDSEPKRALYALINCVLVGVALKLKRTAFLVFGATGVYFYLFHLAWEVFKDSVLFPFVLALLGLGVIAVTILGQHYWRRTLKEVSGRIFE